MDIRLDGKTAIITGGSKGLGKAMAIAFTKAGGQVAIVARDKAVLTAAKEEIGGKTVAIAVDVSKAADCQRAFDEAVKGMGKVDILVNNAGQSQTGAFESITDEVWQADFDLKVFAAIRLSRLAFPKMKERRWGRIVNILNIGAKNPGGSSAPTSVSRAAGLAIMKVLSHEGAPHNVLVNALMTGIIDSDQWVRRHKAQGANKPYPEFLADMAKQMNLPMGRVGRADEYANMALFLVSDAASYINGVSINIDGGKSPSW